MLFTITAIIIAGLVLLEWMRPEKKMHQLTFYISSGLIFILVAFNRMNADYKGYLGSYTNNNPQNEIGYNLLVRLLNGLGLPFESILLLMGILVFLVFYFYSSKQHASLAALAYLIYPLALDLPQVRNLFMYMIALLTLYLIRDRNRVALAGGFALSATFHYFGLLYLPFAWLVKAERKQFYQRLALIFAIISVGTLVARFLPDRMPELIASEISEFDWFYYAIQVIHVALDVALIWWVDQHSRGKNELKNQENTMQELMYRFSWYSIIEIPLVAFSNEMYRFRRNAQLIKYIYSANAIKSMTRRDRWVTLGLLTANLLFVAYMLRVTGDWDLYADLSHNVFNVFSQD
ncbi:MAG: EpsG family protein [Eubacteriales bacterium]|nr:EpsG family protein [Eubacteriales bacterium]